MDLIIKRVSKLIDFAIAMVKVTNLEEVQRLDQRINIGGLDVQCNNRFTPHNIKVVVVSTSKPLLEKKKSIRTLADNQVKLE